MNLLTHLWRLVLSWTVYRKVSFEQDTLEAPRPLPSASTVLVDPALLPVAPPPLSEPAVVDDVEAPLPLPPPPERVVMLAPTTEPLAPLTLDEHGWLIGDKVVRVASKRGMFKFRSRSGKPSGCLWHWTATQHNTGLAMAKRIVTGTGSSVHLWLEHDGTIYQSAPFSGGTGHAGAPSALRVMEDKDGNIVAAPLSKFTVNSFLLGFEIVNVGEVRLVKKDAEGLYARVPMGTKGAVWMAWPFGGAKGKGPIVADDQVVEAVDNQGVKRCYQDFTPGQIEAAERLVRLMHATYGWDIKKMSWGHIDVDPTRKTDPGPRWQRHWLPQILKRALGAS